MILQKLAEYYDRVTADPKTRDALPKPGYSSQKISFCIVIDESGMNPQFDSKMVRSERKQKPLELFVPGENKPTGSTVRPSFLWDTSGFLLGFNNKDKDQRQRDRTQRAFIAFRDKHLALEREINSPAFSAVCEFLRQWDPASLLGRYPELKDITHNYGVFSIAGTQQYVHNHPDVVAYWTKLINSKRDGPRAQCLVSGKFNPITRLHEPKIRGVRAKNPPPGGGHMLVSFNDHAYESLNKVQGENAPVSSNVTFKYANALNYLLSREDRRTFLGDATVTTWADRPSETESLLSSFIASHLFAAEDAAAEDKSRVRQVQNFVQQLREGYAGHEAIDPEDKTAFFILGLSPNASRISVRFWIPGTIGEMKDRLARHLRDIEIIGASSENPLTIRRIVLATGRAEKDPKGNVKSYDADSISPLLSGEMSRSILTGTDYPQMLLGTMLNRMKADGAVNYARVASLKAILIRNYNQEIPVALDIERKDPAYVTGRLFALLEKIQTDSADGNLNSTIKDRYFSSASATPGVVFPRLIRLSQHHLSKLEDGSKIYYDKKLGEVMSKLNGFTSHFTIENQGLFAVGYYHQRQDLYTKKSKEGASE